jgi:hypothetical protein
MSKRVFISSTTTGLKQERRALPGLILGIGMTPVRFEDFTAAPMPSRELCLEAVNGSDVYVLLLGEHYGTPFPDTGLSPTHEEYKAALTAGIPRLAFRKKNVEMEPQQAEFAAEVEAYPSGLFRGSYSDIGDLLAQAGQALRELPAATGDLMFTPVVKPIDVGWRTPSEAGNWNTRITDPEIEIYLTPIDFVLGRSKFRLASETAARLLREIGKIGQSMALQAQTASDGRVIVRANRPQFRRTSNQDVSGGNLEGVSMRQNGEVCAWASLQRDIFGSVVDVPTLAELATPLLGLAGRLLGEVAGTTDMTVVPSVAITQPGHVLVGRPTLVGSRNSSTMSVTGPQALDLVGDESAVLSAIVPGAAEVAREVAAQVVHALEADRPSIS